MPPMLPMFVPRSAQNNPARPAEGSVCPMHDFMAESARGTLRIVCSTSTACTAPTSIGSPSDVPVPCISSPSTSPESILAVCKALRIVRCWEGPLGAVKELDLPSWLTADAMSIPATSEGGYDLCAARSSSATHASPRT